MSLSEAHKKISLGLSSKSKVDEYKSFNFQSIGRDNRNKNKANNLKVIILSFLFNDHNNSYMLYIYILSYLYMSYRIV